MIFHHLSPMLKQIVPPLLFSKVFCFPHCFLSIPGNTIIVPNLFQLEPFLLIFVPGVSWSSRSTSRAPFCCGSSFGRAQQAWRQRCTVQGVPRTTRLLIIRPRYTTRLCIVYFLLVHNLRYRYCFEILCFHPCQCIFLIFVFSYLLMGLLTAFLLVASVATGLIPGQHPWQQAGRC